MTQPRALVLYERLFPGSQVVTGLQDLVYNVQVLPDADALLACAEREKPLLVLVDLKSSQKDICAAVAVLKQNPLTRHLPVIAFAEEAETQLQASARAAGATLVVSESGLLSQLARLLDQALQFE